MASIGPIWQRNPYGTPEPDTQSYSIDNLISGNIIKEKEWNQLKDAINSERKRRNLSQTAQPVNTGDVVFADIYNSFKDLLNFDNDLNGVEIGDLIKQVDIEKLLDKLNELGTICICNCNYCSCNCNNCTCNCFYSCTCHCAY